MRDGRYTDREKIDILNPRDGPTSLLHNLEYSFKILTKQWIVETFRKYQKSPKIETTQKRLARSHARRERPLILRLPRSRDETMTY